MALYRNRLAAALADAVLFCHAAPGSKTETFAKQLVGWGKACYTLDSSHNENLMALGMQPISSWPQR